MKKKHHRMLPEKHKLKSLYLNSSFCLKIEISPNLVEQSQNNLPVSSTVKYICLGQKWSKHRILVEMIETY